MRPPPSAFAVPGAPFTAVTAFRKWLGSTLALALVGTFVGPMNGCSSGSANGPVAADASGEGSFAGDAQEDGPEGGMCGAGEAPGDAGGASYDGTTGKACSSDADCTAAATGASCFHKCTTDANIFASGELFPSGVCVDTVPCDPCGATTPCDGALHGCDGPASPGVCLPRSDPPAANDGICLPRCTFKADGSEPVGCVGKNACNALAFDATTSPPTGVGYCFGGCTSDSDCVPGQKCETSTGLCVKTPFLPSKNLGDGCTITDAYTVPPPCNCMYNAQTNAGFCTTFCTVGGTQCPPGWFCEAQEPTTLAGVNDASVPGFATQNQGMAGFCVPSCDVDGGALGTDSGTCPQNSTCRSSFAGGPGCIPGGPGP